MLAAFYGIFTLMFGPVIFGFFELLSNHFDGLGMLLMLVVYSIVGFIAAIICVAMYNFVAQVSGGFKLELEVEPLDVTSNELQGNHE